MTRAFSIVALNLLLACQSNQPDAAEAGVGGDRSGCEEPGSHSLELSDHSCVCEPGYDWCSDAIDDFDCCPGEDDESDTGEPAAEPELPCDASTIEQLVCLADPAAPEDPRESTVWACNGERWIAVPGYSTFACMADGFPFAYGCEAEQPPSFLCGFGPGSSCDPSGYGSVCLDEDIIDTCVWGLRTVDRCSRLCAELDAFGPGFSGGACTQPDPEQPAGCECCVGC